jgi:precorrin-6A synthase
MIRSVPVGTGAFVPIGPAGTDATALAGAMSSRVFTDTSTNALAIRFRAAKRVSEPRGRFAPVRSSSSSTSIPARRLLLIGIGAGGPSLLTTEAIGAIAEVDAFFVVEKGADKTDLADIRRDVLEQFAVSRPFRVLVVDDGVRDPSLPYEEGVARWHSGRVEAFERLLVDDVADAETAGILVWGDPSLYDSTLRIVDQVNDRGHVRIEHKVFPGISSVQLLTARHRIPLNRIGGSVLITTGRRLREGLSDGVDDIVVMLDAETSFTTVIGRDYEIFWGAYLGGPGELLVAGRVDDVADEIVRIRAQARATRGWIFDTYLLRRVPG